MPDTPAAPKPATRPSRRAEPPRAPTPPGPAAGFPVGPVKREGASEMPPHIPPHMAGAITTPRRVLNPPPGAPAAPARPLHPSFAPPNQERQMHRQAAERLREASQAAAVSVRAHAVALKRLLSGIKSTPEGTAMAEAEGLDLAHLCTFLETLQIAESLTVGPEPEPPPADPAPDKA